MVRKRQRSEQACFCQAFESTRKKDPLKTGIKMGQHFQITEVPQSKQRKSDRAYWCLIPNRRSIPFQLIPFFRRVEAPTDARPTHVMIRVNWVFPTTDRMISEWMQCSVLSPLPRPGTPLLLPPPLPASPLYKKHYRRFDNKDYRIFVRCYSCLYHFLMKEGILRWSSD